MSTNAVLLHAKIMQRVLMLLMATRVNVSLVILALIVSKILMNVRRCLVRTMEYVLTWSINITVTVWLALQEHTVKQILMNVVVIHVKMVEHAIN